MEKIIKILGVTERTSDNEDKNDIKKEIKKFSGNLAALCYSPNGEKLFEKSNSKRDLRVAKITLENGHHSVYDHIHLTSFFNVTKFIANFLNNQGFYNTSERSGRYTDMTKNNNVTSKKEVELYNKWNERFNQLITDEIINSGYRIDRSLAGKLISEGKFNNFSGIFNLISDNNSVENFNENNIDKIAKENARYVLDWNVPTQLVYTTSIRNFNKLIPKAEILLDYLENNDEKHFEKSIGILKKIVSEVKQSDYYIEELAKVKVNSENFFTDEDDYYINSFNTKFFNYLFETSIVTFSQMHRHRTLEFRIEKDSWNKDFYVPKIINDYEELKEEWLSDMKSLSDDGKIPISSLIKIYVNGSLDNLIDSLAKERMCGRAQLENMLKTKEILEEYDSELEILGIPESHNSRKRLNDTYSKIKCSNYGCKEICSFIDLSYSLKDKKNIERIHNRKF